jgi:pimeloyl-ACP methyl ester carboxylesterase
MALPILLLHGFPFDGSMWRPVVVRLQEPAERAAKAPGETGTFQVFAPDLPGFGAPPLPIPSPEDLTIEWYAEVVQRLIRGIGGRAVVGGFSMGGYILLALLRSHPEAVAGAMFISTRADADSAEARANRLRSIEAVRAGGTGGLVEAMLGRLLGPASSETLQEEMRTMMSRQSPAAVIGAQSAMARRRDQGDLLPRIQVPALIVAGAQDVVSPPAVARAMQSQIPHCRLVEIPRAGHMTPLEAPDAVATAIADFARPIA